MKAPLFLIGAALMFWGWQTGHLILAAIAAVLAECANIITLKWDISPSEFNRIADVCNLIFLLAAVYLFTTTKSAGAILVLIQWLPMILLPLLLFQMYGASDTVDVSALFLLMRKKRQKQSEKPPRTINLTYPYAVVCVVSASAANARTLWFYPMVVLLTAWALWQSKSKRYPLPLWFGLVMVAGIGGYWGHIGLHNLQLALEEKGMVWFQDFIRADKDPYRNRTAIGDIGKLKLSDRIVFRVKSSVDAPRPILLREACYNKYNASGWYAYRAHFSNVHVAKDQITWPTHGKRKNAHSIVVTSYLKRGKGLLKLPNNTFRVSGLPVDTIQQNQYGVVKVDGGPGLLVYRAEFGVDSSLDSPPDAMDLSIPEQEKDTLSAIVAELDLSSEHPRQTLNRVQHYFQQGFTYSLYQQKHRRSATPLADFLLHSHSGHCEYFATATVLLLRAAGIPARYASGYSVQEFSRLENSFVVRAKHAHAWALVFVDNRWQDVDTTPPSWRTIERDESSLWHGLRDLGSWCWLTFSEWRWRDRENGSTFYALLLIIPLIIMLARKLFVRARIKRPATAGKETITPPSYPGAESAFYLIEKRLGERGFQRYHWEPYSQWLQRIKASHPSPEAIASLDVLLTLHYRYRFDPMAITAAEKSLLKSKVEAWLEQSSREEPRAD